MTKHLRMSTFVMNTSEEIVARSVTDTRRWGVGGSGEREAFCLKYFCFFPFNKHVKNTRFDLCPYQMNKSGTKNLIKTSRKYWK